MQTIACISQKGGAGKTTLAVHLAAAATASGYVALVIDTDPQATACAWRGWRGDIDPDVIDCGSHALLAKKIKAAKGLGADLVVIDTPPHADIMAREACRCADLLLIPCRPRAFDLDAVRTTIDMAKASAKPAWVVFMGGPTSARNIYADAGELIETYGIPVAPAMIPERAAFHHSVGSGKVVSELDGTSKAALDMAAFWVWAGEQVGMVSAPVSVLTGEQDNLFTGDL